MASSSPKSAPARGVSALPGCYIFLLGAALLVGTGVWAVYTFVHQAGELNAFTDETPAPLEVPVPDPGRVEALRTRLQAFAAAAEARQNLDLVLSKDDLNTMLAGFPRLAEVKPLIRLRSLGPGATFTADIRFPMNSLPGRRRYLNGELDGRFGLHPEAGPFVSVLDVRVPGRTVPPGFVEVYQRGVIPGKNFGFLDDMLVRNFRDDPVFAPTLKRILSLHSTDNALVLSTVKAPASTNPTSEATPQATASSPPAGAPLPSPPEPPPAPENH